jgi:hypothetical protein
MVVLRRKSWVTAMPMLAKEREVRTQARKVRSVSEIENVSSLSLSYTWDFRKNPRGWIVDSG